MLLRQLLDEGLKKTDIAARFGVSRGLIYHWLRTGQVDYGRNAPVPNSHWYGKKRIRGELAHSRLGDPVKTGLYEPLNAVESARTSSLATARRATIMCSRGLYCGRFRYDT